VNLIHVVPEVRGEAAGPSYSVPRLCQSLADQGHDVELSCLGARGEIPGVRLDLHSSWPIAKRFAISPGHACALRRKAGHADIVHNHSLWSMVNVASGWVVPGQRAKLVTSPRGTLSAWALRRSRHIKQLMKPLQWRALQRADLLHATSAVEYQQIRELGFKAPVAIIPNGIDLPNMPDRRPARDGRTLLFLSRIHPIKGVDRLLRAWQAVQGEHPAWRLVIAGCGEPVHEREAHDLARDLKLKRVEFPGPLYGADKSLAYFHADLFVLPTHSENFGVVVAEALAHGCPAIVGKGAAWQGLESEDCGWWISNDIDELADTLGIAMAQPAERLQAMGGNGRMWMERGFGWAPIGRHMASAYRWLLEEGDMPACIRL
jgi:glycosyltransferase involved in cell wall biosynthesis